MTENSPKSSQFSNKNHSKDCSIRSNIQLKQDSGKNSKPKILSNALGKNFAVKYSILIVKLN